MSTMALPNTGVGTVFDLAAKEAMGSTETWEAFVREDPDAALIWADRTWTHVNDQLRDRKQEYLDAVEDLNLLGDHDGIRLTKEQYREWNRAAAGFYRLMTWRRNEAKVVAKRANPDPRFVHAITEVAWPALHAAVDMAMADGSAYIEVTRTPENRTAFEAVPASEFEETT